MHRRTGAGHGATRPPVGAGWSGVIRRPNTCTQIAAVVLPGMSWGSRTSAALGRDANAYAYRQPGERTLGSAYSKGEDKKLCLAMMCGASGF
jgi:hypothetical protein